MLYPVNYGMPRGQYGSAQRKWAMVRTLRSIVPADIENKEIFIYVAIEANKDIPEDRMRERCLRNIVGLNRPYAPFALSTRWWQNGAVARGRIRERAGCESSGGGFVFVRKVCHENGKEREGDGGERLAAVGGGKGATAVGRDGAQRTWPRRSER